MTQTISKCGIVKCVTTVPYAEETLKQMKKAGYRVKISDDATKPKKKGD
jgi:predicted fused transcriptional regulator/phosphomethylpyrimidine kinase